MRKALLIGLIVCVLAVSGIGAAFATGMTFSNVGALSAGVTSVPQINVDGITWVVESDHPAYADYVKLSFDRDISAGSLIAGDVLGQGGSVIQHFQQDDIATAIPASGSYKMSLGADVPIADIYGIRVIVSEETAP